jgi:hypothetical protein
MSGGLGATVSELPGKEYLINLLSTGANISVKAPMINKTTHKIKTDAIKAKMDSYIDAVYTNYWDVVCKYLPSKTPEAFLYSILLNKDNIRGGSFLYKRLNALCVMARELKCLDARLEEVIEYNEITYV